MVHSQWKLFFRLTFDHKIGYVISGISGNSRELDRDPAGFHFNADPIIKFEASSQSRKMVLYSDI